MKIILLLSLLIAFNCFCFGQQIHSFMSPMDSLSSVRKGGFSSSDAGFSIDLPREINGFSGVTGIEYNWRLTEGYYVTGIVDRDTDVENSPELESETLKIIERTFATFARNLFASEFKIVNLEKKNIDFLGHKGIETRFTLTDTLCLIRVFWVKNRAYKVGVLLTKVQQKFEPEAGQVFNSLKIADSGNADELIRKRIEENTPKPLPQTPVAKKLKSDAEDNNLKGKVKTVVQESKFIKGAKARSPKQRDFEQYYNESGNLTKNVSYDATSGKPYKITVYGYLNGSRVLNSNFIENDTSPPAMMIGEAPSRAKRRDNRYHSKYVYKYDTAGNLLEFINYDNAGSIWNRTVYSRKGNVIERILYDDKGKLNHRTQVKIDENGNAVEEISFDSPMPGWTSIYTYKYEEFDKEGNWTKRTMTKSRTLQGKTAEDWTMEEYRTVTYY